MPETPEASAQPDTYASTEASAPTATASASVDTYQSAAPVLSISGETLPANMVKNNVAAIHGVIRADGGVIASVTGELISSSGAVVQQCSYYPETSEFSLAGTLNAELRFAYLTPDTYVYQVSASAVNGGVKTEETLIYHSFTVYDSQAELRGASGSVAGSGGEYSAKLTDDTSNAGIIWNYLAIQLNNPYGAAGILGNIYTESGCIPAKVQGDLSTDSSFSQSYTAKVDDGSISRDAFVGSTPGEKYGQGYGLCQWTAERKGELYDLASLMGCSVGSLDIQCQFLMQELVLDYPELLEYLKTATDARAAALEFCNVFEQAGVRGGRASFAVDYLEKYGA